MAEHVIHPIPLAIRGRRMSDSVYRAPLALGPVSVIGIFVWYIEGPREKILVDCGTTAESAQRAGLTGSTHVQTLEEGLAKYGLKPSDIDIVIQTHLHIDHIELAPAFTRAKFFIQQAELDYHRNSPPPAVAGRPCDKNLLDSLNWVPINGDTSITDGVRTLFTPGHTAGGQSVAVDTAKGIAIIDSLDTTDANWEVPAALQSSYDLFCPGIHNDMMQAFNSLKKIKNTAAIKVPIHEVRFAFIDKIPA